MTTAEAAAVRRPRSSLRQVIVASLIGTTIEWYDFFLYGTAAALVFGKLFFPRSDPLTGVLQAFLTYSLGFVARPIGGLVFGHFGDRIGRKRLLMASLVLMGVSSAAMGLLPTYAQIGVAAPVLLAMLRFVQGFAVGGEWGGAVLMAGEFGDARRRGTWAGWPQVGVPAGNLLAAGVMAVMAATLSEADFLGWGWRVAFLLSGVLVAVGWWVRSTLSESPLFEAAEAEAAVALEPAPALQALKHRPGGIAIGAGLKFGENISYYVLTTFSIAYLAETVHAKRQIGLNAVLIGSFVEMLTLPLFSALSDRIGRRPVYAFGAAAMAVWAFVFFALLHSGGAVAVAGAMAVGLILHGAMYGPQAAFISELFPTRYRYSGASIAYQVTSIFAGSLAPVIAVALLQRTRSTLAISIYVAAACAVSVVAALVGRETKGLSFAEIDAWGGRVASGMDAPSPIL
ncbi:MAG TPA: MFS transporter [Caulobacteraceae bacterium]|nr:MFS transporter [Caulobacteraceae bacterium]